MRYFIFLIVLCFFIVGKSYAASDTTFIYVCKGEKVDMQVAPGELQYFWFKNLEMTSENTSLYSIPNVDITDEAIYLCRRTMTDSAIFILVVEENKPVITIDPVSQMLPLGSNATLSIETSKVDSITYNWFKDEIIIPDLDTNTISTESLQASDTGSYYCVTTNVCGSDTSLSASIKIGVQQLTITEQSADTTVCEGTTIQLKTLAIGSGVITYQWYKDGVAIDNAKTDSLNLIDVGTADIAKYKCILTMDDQIDSTNEITLSVNIKQGLTITSDTTICAGKSIQLEVSGGVKFHWNTGATTSKITVFPSVDKVYKATVTDAKDCLDSTFVYVTVSPVPTPNAGKDTILCGSKTIELKATGGDSYSWNTSAATDKINVTPTSNTKYTVTVTLNTGCTASDEVLVSVATIPVANAGNDISICEGTDTLLIAKGGLTYKWNTAIQDDSVRVAPLINTTYTVTVTNAKGCTDDDFVIVKVNPIVIASASLDTAICVGVTPTLTAGGGTLFKWSTDATTSSINVSPLITTTYTVTVSNDAGCFDTTNVIVTVNALPNAYAGRDVSICLGGKTILYASGGKTFLWSTTKTTDTIIVAPTTDSTYIVTVTSVKGCVAIDSVSVLIKSELSPFAGVDTSLCKNDSIMLFATGGIVFTWNNTATMDNSTVENPNVFPTATTTYIVTVSDGKCTGTDNVIVTANNLPIVTASKDQDVCIGNKTTLKVLGAKDYVWNIGNTLSMIDVTPLITTTYIVTGTDIHGCKAKDSVIVNIHDFPIADAGQDVIICKGSSASLTADGGVSYEWNTSSVSEVITVSPTTTTEYIVTVVNSFDCNDIDTVIVQVNNASTFILQPKSKAVCLADSVVLQVALSGGGISYQWKKNNEVLLNEVDSILIIKNFATTDEAIYTCEATNVCTTLVSNAATLSLSNAVLTTQPQDKVKCKGETLVISTKATGTSVSYQWQRNGIDILGANAASYIVSAVDTSNAGIYTCYTNACTNRLTNPATVVVNYKPVIINQPVSDTICDGDTIKLVVNAVGSAPITYQWKKDGVVITDAIDSVYQVDSATYKDKASYTCVITNLCGSVTSLAAKILFNGPAIITQPVGATVCPSVDVLLSIVATGADTYQWYKNGIAIIGEETNLLGLDSVTLSDEAEYSCLVGNDCGYILSNVVKLDIDVPTIITQPVDIMSCESYNVALQTTATGSAITYNWYFNDALISSSSNNMHVLEDLTKINEGLYFCKLINHCGEAFTDTISLIVNEPIIITQPSSISACLNDSVAMVVKAQGINLLYQWKKDNVILPLEKDSIIIFKKASKNDNGTYVCMISNNCGSLTTSPVTFKINIPVITGANYGQSVCVGDSIGYKINADGVGLNYQWYKNNIAIANEDNLIFYLSSVSANDTAMYYCIVSNVCDDDTSMHIKVSLNMPVITTQPVSQENCWGHNVGFNIKATGTGLSYQWLFNGKEIPNTKYDNYTIENIDTNDNGMYRCRVINQCGEVISDEALLKVNYAVTVVSDPFACEGSTVDITLQMAGSATSYTWKRNGIIVYSGPKSTYTINKVKKDDKGIYICDVTGNCGALTSIADTLDVQYLTVQPEWGAVKLDSSKTLKVRSTGKITEYLWFKDGTQIPGATDSVFTISSYKLTDAGTYKCLLTGDCGSFVSDDTPIYLDDGSGINENDLKGNISYYPNPTTGKVFINTLGIEGKTEISIYTIDGLKVYNTFINIHSKLENRMIDLSNLSQGVYQLRIINNDAQAIRKLVIMK